MEQLPTTARMQEVEQRMEQLPRVAVGLKVGKDVNMRRPTNPLPVEEACIQPDAESRIG
jgi:hypothetical protein